MEVLLSKQYSYKYDKSGIIVMRQMDLVVSHMLAAIE